MVKTALRRHIKEHAPLVVVGSIVYILFAAASLMRNGSFLDNLLGTDYGDTLVGLLGSLVLATILFWYEKPCARKLLVILIATLLLFMAAGVAIGLLAYPLNIERQML